MSELKFSLLHVFRKTCLIVALALILSMLSAVGCSSTGDRSRREVVIYTSVDQVFSEPLLKQFEDETGITVQALYDAEASKTVGLVNRLVAEKNNPVADVFWNGEFVQTLWLKDQGILSPYRSPESDVLPENFTDPDDMWTAFGGRARIMLVNTDLLTEDQYPTSLFDLLDERYPGNQVGLAYPLFGTTATHVAALYSVWGRDDALRFFESLQDKGIQVVDGNSVTRDLVSQGKLAVAYTDTDDALSAINGGKPVAAVFPDQENGGLGTLIVPNTVALIHEAPNPDEARILIDWLLSEETEQRLLDAGWVDIPSHPAVSGGYYADTFGAIRGMDVDFEAVYDQLEASKQDMQTLFIR